MIYIKEFVNILKTKKVFYDEVTFIRAIACILVLTVHVTATLFYSNKEFTAEPLLFFNQIARMGTPIFAIISSFLLMISVVNRGFNLNYFLKTRITKILFPYIIWSFIYLVFNIYFLEKDTHFGDFFGQLMYGTAYTHLYFFLAVFQFYLIFPFVQKLSNPKLIIFTGLTIIVNVIWINHTHFQFNSEFLTNFFYGRRSFLLNWIGFFGIGLVFAKFFQEIKHFIEKNKFLFLMLFGLAFTETWITISTNNGIFSSTRVENLYLVPLFISVLFIIYNIIKKETIVREIFKKIGNYSMGIYLIHPLVLSFFKAKIIDHYGSMSVLESSMFVLALVVVLGVCMALVYLISLLPFSSYIVPIPQRKNKKVKKQEDVPYLKAN